MNNLQGREKQINKFRRKYKYIKKIIKNLIIENAALCDEVAKIQESILIVKDERKFLFRKLMEYENDTDSALTLKNIISSNGQTHNGPGNKIKKRRSPDFGGRSLSNA